MLVLMRRKGESILIGDDIAVTVLSVEGAQVRIGVQAPRSIVVDREEVSERRRAGNWSPEKTSRAGP